MIHPHVTVLADRQMTRREILAHAAASTPAPARPADLRTIARRLQADLAANRRPAITDANALDVQALCVAEEAGELVGAYRRWAGKARRTGTRHELEDEIADVLIVTAVFAERAGIDLDAAIAAKLAVIYSRGWQQPPPAA
jgi:NTP pyrophosphatase (non-canonical NTP hydrolase)